MFTLMMVVFLAACSEKTIHPEQENQRDIAAVSMQKDPAEIYIKPHVAEGLEEESFVIQSKTEREQFKRQLKNPIKVRFSSRQATDNPKN
ncbi:MAG: hypothetical protein WAX48_21690 [Desulfosalsimonadaceae bacterium]